MPRSIPSISVVMPVFNGERYLSEAVESVLAQDMADFEFVIIDDGSTDGTLKMLEEYSCHDYRVRVIRQPNAGIVGALNAGLSAARAPLIARMDADDISLPNRLRLQFNYLTEHERCVAVGSRILLIDEEKWPICEMCTEMTHEQIEEKNLQAGGAAMNHPAVMFRADVVRRLGGYRQEMIYAEDLDLWLRLAEVGVLYNLPEVLVNYRMHPQSISHARGTEQRLKWRKAVEEAMVRRGAGSKKPEGMATEAMARESNSVTDQHIRWAWWALMAGNVRTARKHAITGLKRNPFRIESWRLAACAVRGH